MTATQRTRLLDLARQMRAVAAPVGPMHAWWDPIIDMEALAKGGKPMVDEPVEWFIAEAEKDLAAHAAREQASPTWRLGS